MRRVIWGALEAVGIEQGEGPGGQTPLSPPCSAPGLYMAWGSMGTLIPVWGHGEMLIVVLLGDIGTLIPAMPKGVGTWIPALPENMGALIPDLSGNIGTLIPVLPGAMGTLTLALPGGTYPCPSWGHGATDLCLAWGIWDMIPALPGDMETDLCPAWGTVGSTAAAQIPWHAAGRQVQRQGPQHPHRAGVPGGSSPMVIVGLPVLNHSFQSRQSSSQKVPWKPPQHCTQGWVTGPQYRFGLQLLHVSCSQIHCSGAATSPSPSPLHLPLPSPLHPFPPPCPTFPEQHLCSLPLSTFQCTPSSPDTLANTLVPT